MDNKLLQKGKGITTELQGFYSGHAMYEAFLVPRVCVKKWNRIEIIYRMHTQLLRYYDYWTDGIEDNGGKSIDVRKRKGFINVD
eukprot:11470091-Ditylum_brightwellii.AAC.1